MGCKIGVVIPFYYLTDSLETDIGTLQHTIDSVKPFTEAIVVVDDGTELSTLNDVQLIKHPSNSGKGCAIRTGLEFLLSDEEVQFIVEVDADNDQDPKETYRFLDAFTSRDPSERYLVIGDRYAAPEMQKPSNYRAVINQIQTLLFAELGYELRDSVSGFRGYSRAFAELVLKDSLCNGFGIASEEIILAYLTKSVVDSIPLGFAKPRKNFTKAYKIGEVLEGITAHAGELELKGHGKLLRTLKRVKHDVEHAVNPIEFTIGGKGFSLTYMHGHIQ
ncbi:glycosyltransferase family 2 protein [Candidatus Woesearchaeota archaeon]|nr:glycosyltransferase family 2 protein [Candidatus Woesearchaeota archaeon]